MKNIKKINYFVTFLIKKVSKNISQINTLRISINFTISQNIKLFKSK